MENDGNLFTDCSSKSVSNLIWSLVKASLRVDSDLRTSQSFKKYDLTDLAKVSEV